MRNFCFPPNFGNNKCRLYKEVKCWRAEQNEQRRNDQEYEENSSRKWADLDISWQE